MSRNKSYGLNLGFGCLSDIEVTLSSQKLFRGEEFRQRIWVISQKVEQKAMGWGKTPKSEWVDGK